MTTFSNSSPDRVTKTIQSSAGLVGEKALRLASISSEIATVSKALQSCDTENTISNVSNLTEIIDRMGDHLDDILEHLESVQKQSDDISQISDLTNILSLNAAIQAARSGEAGLQFSVVAKEVKALALRTKESSEGITNKLQDLVGSINQMRRDVTDGMERATHSSRFVSRIAEISSESGESLSRVHELLVEAFERENQLLKMLIQSEIETEHHPFCQKAEEGAAQIQALFEQALESGDLTHDKLFSGEYKSIRGTNPEQFLTPYIAFTDEHLPKIQEPIVDSDSRIAFCAAMRSDGFLPTHILKVTNPQRLNPKTPEDIAWNDANCRTHRFFKDPTGMAVAQNRDRHQVRVYERVLGDTVVIMFDASSPIVVNGEHWGGFRVGYTAGG